MNAYCSTDTRARRFPRQPASATDTMSSVLAAVQPSPTTHTRVELAMTYDGLTLVGGPVYQPGWRAARQVKRAPGAQGRHSARRRTACGLALLACTCPVRVARWYLVPLGGNRKDARNPRSAARASTGTTTTRRLRHDARGTSGRVRSRRTRPAPRNSIPLRSSIPPRTPGRRSLTASSGVPAARQREPQAGQQQADNQRADRHDWPPEGSHAPGRPEPPLCRLGLCRGVPSGAVPSGAVPSDVRAAAGAGPSGAPAASAASAALIRASTASGRAGKGTEARYAATSDSRASPLCRRVRLVGLLGEFLFRVFPLRGPVPAHAPPPCSDGTLSETGWFRPAG